MLTQFLPQVTPTFQPFFYTGDTTMMAWLDAREKKKSNVLVPSKGKSQPAGIFFDEPSALAAASKNMKGQDFISYQEVLDELPLALPARGRPP